MRRHRSPSLSTYAKTSLDGQVVDTGTDKDVDEVLRQIQNLELDPIRQNWEVPSVVNRLMKPDEPRSKRMRRRKLTKTPKEPRVVREVKKIENPAGAIPNATHYNPNFDAVLSKAPKLAFEKSGMAKKKLSPASYTMSEMLSKWNGDIRCVEFRPEPESVPEDENQEQEQRKKKPAKPRTPGVMSSDAARDSFLKVNTPTPGPTDYEVPVNTDKVKMVLAFDQQPSRPSLRMTGTHATVTMRDIRQDIEYTKPRTPKCIPFDKQSGRTPRKAKSDAIWDEIEQEQARIIASLRKPEEKKKPVKKHRQPFALQTSKPSHPFGHLMRKEVTPEVEYDVERSRRALDRPRTAFDISQPSLGSERIVYKGTDAPDVIYDNVNEQFKNTIPRAATPLAMSRETKRHSPYHYMPKPCGEGDLPEPKSSLNGKGAVELSKMGKRKCLLDSPYAYKRATRLPKSRWAM